MFHKYVDAPLDVNTAELPIHTTVDVDTTVGKLVTEIVPTAAFLQPVVAVPVTV